MTHHAAAAQPPRRLEPPTRRVALVLAAAVVVGVLLYLGREALTPFIVGALLVYILDPAVGFVARLRIGKRTIPRGLAVLLVYIATFFLVVEALALLLGPLISQLVGYLRDLPQLLQTFDELLAQLAATYASLDLPDPVRAIVDDAIAGLSGALGDFDFGTLLPVAQTLAGAAAALFGYLIIPIWAFYLLRDRVRLTNGLAAALPSAWRDDAWAVLAIIERVFGRWIRAQLILGVIIGVVTWAGLMLLGWLVDPRFQDFAVLLAVVAGIFELLPIIGPILSMIPTLLVALTTQDPLIAAVAVVGFYTLVQQVEGAVLVPWIQGEAVELHPSVVIFVLIVGGAIAGLIGAILAIPVTAAGIAVYRYLFHRVSDDATPAEAMPIGPPAEPPREDPADETAGAALAADDSDAVAVAGRAPADETATEDPPARRT